MPDPFPPSPLAEIYDMAWVEDEAECIVFTVLANGENGVEMFLEVAEVGGDLESPMASYRLNTTDWAKTVDEFPIPEGIEDINIVVRKTGKGTGSIAFFGATAQYYCVSTSPAK